jgi:hypothetical protein
MHPISAATINHADIDNFMYTYYTMVMLCSAAHELHSVVIYYEE